MHPRTSRYDCASKFDSKPKTGFKFECDLLGEKQTLPCLGYVRGAEKDAKAAAYKIQDSTTWRLTKASLEGRVEAAFLHMLVKGRVDMHKYTFAQCVQRRRRQTHLQHNFVLTALWRTSQSSSLRARPIL